LIQKKDDVFVRYLHETIENASSVLCVTSDGRTMMFWNVAARNKPEDYGVRRHDESGGSISRRLTAGEARRLVLWAMPETLQRTGGLMYLMYLSLATEAALRIIQGRPTEEHEFLAIESGQASPLRGRSP
jgi:hypothetical protein